MMPVWELLQWKVAQKHTYIPTTLFVLASQTTTVCDAVSYPESSGFLVSGETPARLWGHQILLPQDFCGKTMETVTEQPIKKIELFRCPQSLPGVAPLTKKLEDSGYEIVCDVTIKLESLVFRSSKHLKGCLHIR